MHIYFHSTSTSLLHFRTLPNTKTAFLPSKNRFSGAVWPVEDQCSIVPTGDISHLRHMNGERWQWRHESRQKGWQVKGQPSSSCHILWKQADGVIITQPSQCVNLYQLTKVNLSGNEFKHWHLKAQVKICLGSAHTDKACWFGGHLSSVNISTLCTHWQVRWRSGVCLTADSVKINRKLELPTKTKLLQSQESRFVSQQKAN